MLNSITEVFGDVITWIIEAMQSVLSVFYTVPVDGGTGSLTFLGVLSVASLGISIFFLILGTLQSFLRFR